MKKQSEYETFESALKKVLTVSHEEMQNRLRQVKEKPEAKTSSSGRVSHDKAK